MPQNSMIYTFVNDYAPYTESSVNIKPYWHTKNGEVLNEIDTQLKENKRIIVSVTSEKLASWLYNNLHTMHPNKTIKLYTGNDLEIYEDNKI